MNHPILYVEIDEELSSIYRRLSVLKAATAYLVVPQKALLFQGAVNLKILKEKADAFSKNLIIVTQDPGGQHRAKRSGLEVLDSIDVEPLPASLNDPPHIQIQPIQARRNEVLKDTPKRFTEKKITIAELIRDFRTRSSKTQNKKPWQLQPLSFYFKKSPRKFVAALLGLSAGLFLFVSYLVLPGATIYVKPAFDEIHHTVNVTLADRSRNQNLLSQNQPHVIQSEKLSTLLKQTRVFTTTSQEFQGENARGKLTIFNQTDDPWDLKESTRFQTKEGLIFRLKKGVTVPAGGIDSAGQWNPGEMEATVEADPFDFYGAPAGERGNISPSRFFLPALSKVNQNRLFAESKAPMTGGVTAYRKVVTEADIEAAKKQIEESLILLAKEELQLSLKARNQLDQTQWVLLSDDRYFKTKLLEVVIPEDLLGSSREKFEIFAKIQAEGIGYDFDQLFAFLKKELKGRVHPSMQLREDSLVSDNIHYEVIEENSPAGLIKLTVTLQGIEEFVVSEEKEAGRVLNDKIKNRVKGLSLEDAEKVLNNFPEVEQFKVRTWPFWISSMPRLTDNIRVELWEGNL